jgi:hypothetical protein
VAGAIGMRPSATRAAGRAAALPAGRAAALPAGRAAALPAGRAFAAGWAGVVVAVAAAALAADPAVRPPDPLAEAVIRSLAARPKTTPHDLLETALRAAEVDAFDLAVESITRLGDLLEQAGDARGDVLADLGEAFEPADLRGLDRVLGDRHEDVRPIMQAIRAATRARHRDPARLAAAAAGLSADSAAARRAAADRLAAAGLDGLPTLVGVLGAAAEGAGVDPARQRAAALARQLVRDLGPEARQPLLAWLGSDDVPRWAGVIEALAATDTADRDADFAEFLLAPALVADTPPAARAAAVRLLERLERRAGRDPREAGGPDAATAVALIAKRLDGTLTAAGLPAADRLLVEPVADPATAVATDRGTVERIDFDPRTGRVDRVNVSPRAARAKTALHLARDLVVLGTDDAAAVRLVLLARLEAALVAAGESPAGPRLPADRAVATLSGPAGFDFAAAADVLETACGRGMHPAAAAAAAALEAAHAATGPRPEPLPPRVRKSLLAALEVPDATVQFEAARTLALAAGDQPYDGSSRVVDMLLRAATATGADVAVVAHHDAAVRQQLATDLSRFGYRVETVATGREAILATRALADVVLVMIGARTVRPGPLETVELVQRQPHGDVPPVLVMIDPLDDDARGRFLTCLLLAFGDTPCVGVTDRMDSLLATTTDPETGAVVGPRLHDRLAQIAGPDAVVPAVRRARADARRGRAAEALALLAHLGRHGRDVSAAETIARLALQSPAARSPSDLFAPAVAVLSTIGSPEAQQAVLREIDSPGLPDAARRLAATAFAASVERYGLLLGGHAVADLHARYNRDVPPADRAVAAAVLEALELHRRKACPPTADAAPPRPTR